MSANTITLAQAFNHSNDQAVDHYEVESYFFENEHGNVIHIDTADEIRIDANADQHISLDDDGEAIFVDFEGVERRVRFSVTVPLTMDRFDFN